MKIDYKNYSQNKRPQTFTARNPEIRFADDIMRRVNQEFPMLSPARIYDTFGKKNISPEQRQFMQKIGDQLKYLRNSIPEPSSAPDEYAKKLAEAVKKYKLGNCGEAGTLAKVGLAINGIKGVKVGLYGYSTPKMATSLDYTLIMVNLNKNADLSDYKTFGKKAYVVNPWGGFVGYVDEVFEKLKAGYTNDKRMPIIKTFGIKIRDFDISEKTLKEIEKQHPSLKIKPKKAKNKIKSAILKFFKTARFKLSSLTD